MGNYCSADMFKPFSFYVGLRYAGTKRESQLVSFISLVSMLGMTVGVALLIVVLSVMNGFDKEMRNRILGLVPHITIKNYAEAQDWQPIANKVSQHPEVKAVAPFVQVGGMILRGTDVESVLVYGIDVEHETKVSIINEFISAQVLQRLETDSRDVILGKALAQRLNLSVGEHINLMVPQQANGKQAKPKFIRLGIAGLFHTGTEIDQSVALMAITTAEQLMAGDVSAKGLRVSLVDTFAAPRVAWELEQNLPYGFASRDWTRSHGNLYSAIQLSKQLVALMLFTIIAVAAFNVVSALVMVVTDKQADIAILRTLGVKPKTVMAIFMVQGTVIGLIGTGLGVILGLLLSICVADVVAMIEGVFNHQFLNSDVYPIDYMPVDIRWGDVTLVALVAFSMSILATLYPAWRAARVQPAEALRYE